MFSLQVILTIFGLLFAAIVVQTVRLKSANDIQEKIEIEMALQKANIDYLRRQNHLIEKQNIELQAKIKQRDDFETQLLHEKGQLDQQQAQQNQSVQKYVQTANIPDCGLDAAGLRLWNGANPAQPSVPTATSAAATDAAAALPDHGAPRPERQAANPAATPRHQHPASPDLHSAAEATATVAPQHTERGSYDQRDYATEYAEAADRG
jgi:hypothetical protein